MLQALARRQHVAELDQFVAWSGVALAIMTLASIGVGWVFAGRMLAPVRTMTTEVRRISATSLHRRLVTDRAGDELSELGSTFNELLQRLERSFDAQRQFIANASHELRTPLARQRTLIQVALDDPTATVETLRSTATRVLVAGDQQESLIEALLTLASGARGLERRAEVDLRSIADDVVDSRLPDAERSGIRIHSRLDAAVTMGDPRLLERLVTNLLDNAIRYNTSGGWVEVATSTVAGMVTLRIVNGGPVVPAADVDRLFEPFQRLDSSRVRRDGWGLGLSIVRAITDAHDGTLAARARRDGGLDIAISFRAPGRPVH